MSSTRSGTATPRAELHPTTGPDHAPLLFSLDENAISDYRQSGVDIAAGPRARDLHLAG